MKLPTDTLEAQLLSIYPGISYMSRRDWDLAISYIKAPDYESKAFPDPEDWYETVHTFILLVLEAEGR